MRRKWRISDHLPVVVKISLPHEHAGIETITVFDRKKLCKPKIAEAIKNHQYNTDELDPLLGVKQFHDELQKLLRSLKVIREEKKKEFTIFYPKHIKRAICSKRLTDKKVRKGILPLSELILARKTVAKQIKLHKRKLYLNTINKGVKFLKHNDSKNSWKWVKNHSGIGRNKMSIG